MQPTINQALSALLSAFPSADSGNAEHTAMAYMLAVEGEPPAAVAEAVRRFIRGEVKRDRHTFLPSTAELAIEVRARAEMIAVRAIAAQRAPAKPVAAIAAPVSDDMRARVSGMMRDLVGTMRGPVTPAQQPGEWHPDMTPVSVTPSLATRISGASS